MDRNWWEESYFTDDQKSDAEPKKNQIVQVNICV